MLSAAHAFASIARTNVNLSARNLSIHGALAETNIFGRFAVVLLILRIPNAARVALCVFAVE